MSKIIIESNELENLLAKLSSIPAQIYAISMEIDRIREHESETKYTDTRRSKFNASNLTYILEEYTQNLSKDFYSLYDKALDFE